MFSYDLNLSQAQEILKNLYELHTLPETEKQVFFGSCTGLLRKLGKIIAKIRA